MKKTASAYAQLLVNVEWEHDPNRDDQSQALDAMYRVAKEKYGLYRSDFEFTDFTVFDSESENEE